MKLPASRILFFLLALAGAQLACTISMGGPAYPATRIAVSTKAVSEFNQNLMAAQTAAVQSGILAVSITETQATSLLANNLDTQTDPFILDPQVYLRDGQIQIYGKASRGNLEANVRITLSAALNPDGKPVVTVTSADFGPLPAPVGLNDTISAMIDQAFTGTIGPAATGLRLESITITNGILTLTGRVK